MAEAYVWTANVIYSENTKLGLLQVFTAYL